MPPAYRVEVSNTNRATCQLGEHKKNAVKIAKGELRFGVWVDIQEHGSWKWRHWGCVTPEVAGRFHEFTEGDLDLVDGFEDLPPEHQEKVRRALEQLHVDDEDWVEQGHDPEDNKAGAKTKRTRTPKKKPEDAADEEADEEGPSTPTKGKKRGRPKKTDEEVEEEEKPVAKKSKAKSKKSEPADDEALDDAPKAKKPRKGKKAAADADANDAEQEDEPAKPRQSRSSKKSAKSGEAGDVAEDEDVGAKPAPKKRGRPAKDKASK